MGSKDNNTAKIKTPIEEVTFNRNNLAHLITQNEESRLSNLNKVVRTLQAPNLIVQNVENGSEYKYYIKSFEKDGKQKGHLQVIKCKPDGNFYVTNYPLRNDKFKHTVKVLLDPTQKQLDLIAQAETEAVSKREDKGAVLKALSKSRSVTLSPAIYNNDLEISPEEFIESSPKLKFVANAIEEMLKKQPKTGQLLYMPLGVDFLPKIKQYFVNKKVFKPEEIAIIKSGVDDDKISEITSSFNDENGTIKLIIGTSKMREGMNLNGNTSVLYIPYLDWNPTDYVQIVGRIWRQGNNYNDIRVVVPLLKNSSDSFIFQKHDEKTSRINNIMDRGKDYIDTAELNTAEEKLNMITNPDKKAMMFYQIKEQELNNKKAGLEAKLSTVQYYRRELKNIEFDINRCENQIKYYETRL